MTRGMELTTRLRALARLAEDRATTAFAEMSAHEPEFERVRAFPPSPESHARLLELHPHVFAARQEGDQARDDDRALRAAADRIEAAETLLVRARSVLNTALGDSAGDLANPHRRTVIERLIGDVIAHLGTGDTTSVGDGIAEAKVNWRKPQ